MMIAFCMAREGFGFMAPIRRDESSVSYGSISQSSTYHWRQVKALFLLSGGALKRH